MSDNVFKTQTIQIIGDQVNELSLRMNGTDSSITELKVSMAEVKTNTSHMVDTSKQNNVILEKLATLIDRHHEKLIKRVSVLEAWRNWCISIGGIITALGVYFREDVIQMLKHIKLILILATLLLTGCANVSSTRLLFKSDQSTLLVEIPKEIEAKNIRIEYDSQQGTFKITADSWISRNTDTILSQASREKAFLEGSSSIIEKATSAAVSAAIKSVVPIP